MKKKILGIIIFLLILNLKVFAENNIFVIYKIENEIITNIDIMNESKYLLALSTELKNLDNKKISKIAEGSIIRETIKKIELLKYFDLDKEREIINKYVENFYLTLNIDNLEQFKKYLENYDLSVSNVKKKIIIETSWNQLIYDKYKDQVNINIENLKKKIKLQKNSEYNKSYKLSEIYFEKTDKSIEETYKKIEESIKEIGFQNTANLYSVSESAKFGGKLPWVQEKNLTNQITKVLNKKNIGSYTKPIIIGNKFLILNIDDVKKEKKEINEKKELEKMIKYETNRQLSQFSKIYYDKVKINTVIDEL
jgi:peptidyl-prolyl cis-trans isomerase SurA